MVNKILIILDNGRPLYYYNSDRGNFRDQGTYIAESAFFSAITQFAYEIATESVKYVVFEGENYVIEKVSNILVIFSVKGTLDEVELKNLEYLATNLVNFIIKEIPGDYTSGVAKITTEQFTGIIPALTTFLIQEQLIDSSIMPDPNDFQYIFQTTINDVVGYIPGIRNAGIKTKRIVFNIGLDFLLLSLIAYILMISFDLIRELRLLLIFPLFIAFCGLFQFYFSFDIVNAFRRKYDMR